MLDFTHSQASLDDPTQTVVMHRSEPSRLQSLALQLADKVNNFVDSNERIFEMKSGVPHSPIGCVFILKIGRLFI